MKIVWMSWWLWLGAVAFLPAQSESSEGRPVCVIKIHEDISHNTVYLIQRGLKQATERRAVVLILDMETNGGRVDSTEEIIKLLERAPLKTVTYVNGKAFSAGAFIAAATDEIYMAPGSVIGAATPVMLIPGQGIQELPKSFEEKMGSAMRALIRATAQQKGHNSDVFEAMVDRERGLVVDGETIVEKGKLLTLTNEEAARQYGDPPKPLLSAGTVASLAELRARLGVADGPVMLIEPYGFEVAARWITMLSPLLIMIGMAAIYLELKTPGLGVPTVVAAVAFGIYFLGFFLAGLAGWEETVIFVVGVGLLLVEIFVLPGFGVAGFAGMTLILVSLMMAMVEKWPGGPSLTWPQFQVPFLRVAGGFIGSVVTILLLGRLLPESRFFKRLELAATTSSAEGYTTAAHAATDLVGATGVAATPLRPAGKGQFGDRLVDVVTAGELIERGAAIRVVSVQGMRVLVERAG